jgi:signal transduction histidine kinase
MKKPTYKDLEKRVHLLEVELEQFRRSISSAGSDNIPIHESDEKYRIIFNNLTEAVALHKMITDDEGNIVDFTYEDLNPARERMISQTVPEIKKLTVRQANPDVGDDLIHTYGKTALTGLPVSFEHHSEVYDRDLRVKLFSHKYGYIGTIIEDVTTQKKSEQKLRLNEKKLRQLNLTKDKLFSIIAHDLRSPFNSIIGYSQLLRENIRKYNVEESEKYIDYIHSSAQSTFNLLINLLSWAKNQTGQTTFNPENLELNKIVEEVAELLSSSAKTKNISINFLLPEKIKIHADRYMLRTILQNLIFNAIKFTKPGGKIDITASASAGNVEVTVSDNGIGIEKKALKNLFELAAADTTQGTSNETGSGLGLVICREFVERQGGKIRVDSIPGKGSDFKFTLPFPA